MIPASCTLRLIVCCTLLLVHLPAFPIPAEEEPPPDLHLNDPTPTTILVRVVAHRSMVLGKDVGGARVTITDVASGRLLATGLQQGEAGDQNQIMRTPHVMEEPLYSSRPSASFMATLELTHPILVEIAAEGPLAFPASTQRASTRVWLTPGHDLTHDGVVLALYGYIVEIQHPTPGESLFAKDDVMLSASIRTLSGALVRPHGDWDSRKVHIYGELLIGGRIMERLQMFYSGEKAIFEAPFFVPLPSDAPDGITLRVVAADAASGNAGIGQAAFPVLHEQLPSRRR
jgi:hypothetical protein